VRRQQTEDIDECIINSIVFSRQLSKEHLRKVRNASIFVLEAFSHLTKLTFDFNLASKDKKGQGHKACLFDGRVSISKSAIEKIGVFVNQSVEANSLARLASSRRICKPYHQAQ